jgi:diguanylate cyclase (GGDEF)-like protein
MLKYQVSVKRLAMPGVLSALLLASAFAHASEQSALTELKSIRVLADHADMDALRRIEMVRLSLPPDASPLLRRELAKTEERVRGCLALTAAGTAAGSAATAAGAAGDGAVGKPSLGTPAFGTVAARSPGMDRPRAASARAATTVSNPHRMRLLWTTLAAVLAAAAAGTVFMMYRRAQEKSERLAQLNRELEEHARRDPLTRLQNRRAFLDKMTARNASGRRSADGSGATDCITLMNIDHFRLINDRLGHDVGDAVLAEVGRRLNRVVRDTDMLVRWGGEEFLVYSPNAHPQQMRMMLERVMNAVGSTPIQVEVHSIAVTISAGLACVPFAGIPEDKFDWQKVVSLANKALHHAKRQGRNRALAVADLKADAVDALAAIEADFPDAVAQGLVVVMNVPGPAGAQLKQLQPA